MEKWMCEELFSAAQEYRVRELAFYSCVNLIANALGRCDFRTYAGGKEVKGKEFYLWNIDPGPNQNSSAFLHKLVATLYQNNEALIVPGRRRQLDGTEFDSLLVADSWAVPDPQATRQNRYEGVTVDNLTFNKTFREEDVLHLTLNHCDVKPVLDGVYESYKRLISAAVNNYVWNNGQHWTVTVDQIAAGRENWRQEFQQIINDQFKPFLNSINAVLPQFNGYNYQPVGKATDAQRDASNIKNMIQDVFDFTANAFLIPPVLLRGQVEGIADANQRFLTNCIDPLADQLGEEITRKRYGYDAWRRGSYLRVDTSAIGHFNLFDNAASFEKLIGSGWSYNDLMRAAGGQEIDEPWANEHFMTKNFARAEALLNGEEGNENGTDSEGGGGEGAGAG